MSPVARSAGECGGAGHGWPRGSSRQLNRQTCAPVSERLSSEFCHLSDYCGDLSGGMMINSMMTAEEYSDQELVARSLGGDREAFSCIVSRYQTLICSLAYSRVGNLGQSEDIAQETFITA